MTLSQFALSWFTESHRNAAHERQIPSVPPSQPRETTSDFVPAAGIGLASTASKGRTPTLVEAMPLAAIALILALLASFVWLADRREREEANDNLIRDALWVEQALRFQIDATRDAIDRIAVDLARGALDDAAVGARFTALQASHPELVQLVWRDAIGEIRASVGEMDQIAAAPPTSARPPATRGFRTPVLVPGQGAIAELSLVLPPGSTRTGQLTARLSLERLLTLHVPWWISQNSRAALLDRDRVELAHTSAVMPGRRALRHDIDFDPPLPGVVLALMAHHAVSNFSRNMIGAGIVALAGVTIASLFMLMRHYRGRLAAELSLGEAQALRRAMEESLTVGMRARDLEERILYVNPAFCRMVGWKAEDLVGRTPPLPYWLPELVEETLARHQALGTKEMGPVSFETRFQRSDGRVFDVLVYEAPLIDAGGVHRGWMGSIIDITDRKKAEDLERLQAEKMAQTGRLISMGEMASTISHEINQPLAAIASYASGCLHLIETGRPPGDLVGALRKLDAQVQRAGQVIRRVHDFVRKREPSFSPLDLSKVIADLVAFIGPDARKAGCEIALDIGPDPLPVRADPILIEQVLFNLMRNGMEAMAGGRRGKKILTVSARRTAEPAEISVDVADRGPGIPPEIAAKLFTPFFSTKPQGMGMGLAICRSIVERHQGRLEFTQRTGGGTVFTLTLPLDEGTA